MTKEEFKKLIQKYNNGNCSIQEQKVIEFWYSLQENTLDFDQSRIKADQLTVRNNLQKHLHKNRYLILFSRKWNIAAAILLLALCASTIYYFQESKSRSIEEIASILPAKEKIKLELNNGKTILIDQHLKDTIQTEEGLLITVDESGNLNYQQKEIRTNEQAIAYHTLSTPKGATSKITLVDGTVVILNASSSIRFPNRFTTAKREVYLEGEGYFEVQKMANAASFIVKSQDQAVQVLGTKFIVKNYKNEQISQTSLLEGRVQVESPALGKTIILSPGDEAILTDQQFIKKGYDESSTSWIHNDFIFIDADLTSICKTLERWYDVQFHIDPAIQSDKFTAAISMRKSLQEVLKIMASSHKLHFEIKANTIHITKI